MLNLIEIIIYNISMLIKGMISPMLASNNRPSRGQVLLEYAVILAIVVAAILGMKLYVQRMLQGGYRAASDRAIRTMVVAQGLYDALPLQYDPYYEESSTITSTESDITKEYQPGGSSSIRIDKDDTSTSGMRWELPYSR